MEMGDDDLMGTPAGARVCQAFAILVVSSQRSRSQRGRPRDAVIQDPLGAHESAGDVEKALDGNYRSSRPIFKGRLNR